MKLADARTPSKRLGRFVAATLLSSAVLGAALTADRTDAQEQEPPRRERTGLRRPVLRLLRQQIREFVEETVREPETESADPTEAAPPQGAADAQADEAGATDAAQQAGPDERLAVRTQPVQAVAAADEENDDLDLVLDEALRVAAERDAHPLAPAIALAKYGVQYIDEFVTDYTCRLVKAERYNGTLRPVEHIDMKFRHEPFSVYMSFLAPEALKGQEGELYVEGKYGSKLLGHAGSGFRARFGTVELKPDGALAMAGQLYPITHVGMRNLMVRLVEVAEKDLAHGECDVKYYRNAKMDGRPCLCVEVTHPQPREHFRFHLARIFIDRELQLPVRYESFLWPEQPGGEPPLIERYSYTNVRVNVGLTEGDFDRNNPAYRF